MATPRRPLVPWQRAAKFNVSRTVSSAMCLSSCSTYTDVRSGMNSAKVRPLYVTAPLSCRPRLDARSQHAHGHSW